LGQPIAELCQTTKKEKGKSLNDQKHHNPIPDDLKQVFDTSPEPRDLSSDWFERLEQSMPSDDEITAWLNSLESLREDKKKVARRKPIERNGAPICRSE
jgi:hypothetical protein